MGRSKSSSRWMQEHFEDEYVKMAQAQGYRSRAVFKLKEIQDKDQLIKPGMNIIDLGAAPGGWSQFARQIVGKKDKIIALDILAMDPLEGVDFIQGDFREQAVLDQLYAVLDGAPINLVMSDMAPNMSGNKGVDQPRSIYLGELALETAKTVLAKDGVFLVKLFHGAGFEDFHKEVQQSFAKVIIRKPKASRPRSNEVYILAKGFK
ncbi:MULTISPECIES: 23S rRNA (uridine(2552)-2'-O)-methyltransferase RlmE [Methylobacter]|jgi:23S rRNA (uridine2552-2'-O)-methyltransferase|uniref:23S rRNA (uridine(2552)-2'-O)-methyltransferase RlmE n=1 Tax=Methylobacter TaxID=429 RepID=UPI0004DF528F|nr:MULTISPECIES: 23S rRNA (uridine(2552)-2'-O)-methyltransferase RlmE [Methylobacter]MDD4905270.1 23S rRNA (uridine(2552)-2'-O)-methyltransferase RlmE [Methylobacter tundripaludum]MDI1276423.1 23S rRNA (uridine(2552)-2'-O)-methyltransferase RlmE [Methylobacter sp.]MDI1357147.1 23S rRNA (uridine(2552)-2'-O)-methyltransferase RlmE [Methylobacter sp.]